MKSKILLLITAICIAQALKEYKNFEYYTTIAVIEAPLRLLNDRAMHCYKEIEPVYEKINGDFKHWSSNIYTDILHYLDQRNSAKIALSNLKLISGHLKWCQETLSILIPARNFTEAAFIVWDCRKTLQYEIGKFRYKMDIFRYHKDVEKEYVNITVEDLLTDYYKKSIVLSKKVRTCIKGTNCSDEKCAFELGL